jgi:hypothetical protein
VNARYVAEQEKLDERVTETRTLLETEQGLRTFLAEAGKERVERACVELGWAEAEA